MNPPISAIMGGSPGSPSEVVALVSLIVIVAFDLALIKYCLDDLNRRLFVAGGDKRFWTAVIILGGPVGQCFYMLYGRGPY